jgi:hypothetical protein
MSLTYINGSVFYSANCIWDLWGCCPQLFHQLLSEVSSQLRARQLQLPSIILSIMSLAYIWCNAYFMALCLQFAFVIISDIRKKHGRTISFTWFAKPAGIITVIMQPWHIVPSLWSQIRNLTIRLYHLSGSSGKCSDTLILKENTNGGFLRCMLQYRRPMFVYFCFSWCICNSVSVCIPCRPASVSDRGRPWTSHDILI